MGVKNKCFVFGSANVHIKSLLKLHFTLRPVGKARVSSADNRENSTERRDSGLSRMPTLLVRCIHFLTEAAAFHMMLHPPQQAFDGTFAFSSFGSASGSR